MRTLDRLDEMIANAKQISGVGERAEKAAAILASGELVFQYYQGQTDVWICRSLKTFEPYTVSHKGLACTCSDFAAPRTERLGKLCKHRLAVMFAVKLRNESLYEITEQLRGAQGGRLRIDLHYGTPQLYFVNGFHVFGQPEVRLEHPASRGLGWHRFQIDPLDVAQALCTIGWSVTANVKQKAMIHSWTLAPGGDERTSLAVMRGQAGNSIELTEQRKRLEELDSIQDLMYT